MLIKSESNYVSFFRANIETDRALKSILDVLGRNSGLSAVRCAALGRSPRLTDRGLAVLARRCSLLQQLGGRTANEMQLKTFYNDSGTLQNFSIKNYFMLWLRVMMAKTLFMG
jgi:hypothetical protein